MTTKEYILDILFPQNPQKLPDSWINKTIAENVEDNDLLISIKVDIAKIIMPKHVKAIFNYTVSKEDICDLLDIILMKISPLKCDFELKNNKWGFWKELTEKELDDLGLYNDMLDDLRLQYGNIIDPLEDQYSEIAMETINNVSSL